MKRSEKEGVAFAAALGWGRRRWFPSNPVCIGYKPTRATSLAASVLRLLQEFALGPVGMVLDLVAEDVCVLRSLLDHRGRKVAHAYLLYAPLLLQLGHRPQGLLEWHAGVGPVHEQQVNVLGSELL